MQFILLLVACLHSASGGKHSLRYYFTGVAGDVDLPELTVVGLVDGVQFMYFDSKTMKAVPKTDWIRENLKADYWEIETQTNIGQHETFKNNMHVAKNRFNHSDGLHTFQQMYGCEWDDQTGAKSGFRSLGYDGEDFGSLDLKNLQWVSPVQQGLISTCKWNNNRAFIESDSHYFDTVCIEWLQKYLEYGKSSLQKTASPQVSLLQKSFSSPVVCHATGFYPSGIKISWQKNEQDHDEDVELGKLLPNSDGTFQKTSTLNVKPEEWKNNKFRCVVEHQGETKAADEKILTNENSAPIGLIAGVVAALLLLVFIDVAGYMVYQKKKGFKPLSGSDDGSNCSAHAVPHS